MQPLHGVGVLVTRPRQQASALCRRLEAEGATTFRLPAIEIEPAADARAIAARVGPIEQYALIVFSSANAVRFGHALLDERRDLNLAAIGPATARALNQAGYRVAVQPVGGFDSESLLRHPQLALSAGDRVLIVKGGGGRELLREELARRGAQVTVAEVYRREPSVPDAAALAELQALFDAGAIQAITATSAETGLNLLALAAGGLRAHFERALWVVPGARVAAALRARGLSAPVLEAASAEDQDLVAALVRWRSSASGA